MKISFIFDDLNIFNIAKASLYRWWCNTVKDKGQQIYVFYYEWRGDPKGNLIRYLLDLISINSDNYVNLLLPIFIKSSKEAYIFDEY